MESPGQNTGVSSPSLLQGNLPNPEIELRSPKLQVDSLPAEPQGKPRIMEWVAYPFSRGYSWPRNWTGVSCIAGWFFTSWAIRGAHKATSGSCFLYPYFWRNQKFSLEKCLICKGQYPTANLLTKQQNESMNSWPKQKSHTKYLTWSRPECSWFVYSCV